MKPQDFKILFVVITALLNQPMWAQSLLYNNGTELFLNTGAIVEVNGNTENHTGTFTNNGDILLNGDITNDAIISGNGNYFLTGNWFNNQLFTGGGSTVFLQGANQIIGGLASSTFNNLSLSGTGIKYLHINTQVTNILDLSDREMATEGYVLSIQNTNTNAIHRTTGFVSSLTNGYLQRFTNASSSYLFPVGSSVGAQRYRPVEIIPQTTGNASFNVRMVNNDASIDGYDRTLVDSGLCKLEPNFYHLISRTSGTTDAIISIFYDELSDGYWDEIANWQSTVWHPIGNTIVTQGTPLNQITSPVVTNFSNLPYILAVSPPTVNLGSDTTICTGTFVTLDAGVGFDSYIWSTSDTTQTIDVYTDGTYSITVTLGTCSDSDEIKVTEHLLNITVGTEDTICQGDNAQLFASGGTTYLWSTGDTASIITVSPTATTTYYVTVSDNLCSQIGSVTIYVSDLPTVDAGQDQTICNNDSVTLSATGNGISYLWSTGDSTASITVHPTTTTTYIVTVSNMNGCSASDDVTVTVVYSVNVTISGDNDICMGDNTTLIANGAVNYQWNTGQTDNSIVVSPISDSTFTVIGSIGSCSDTATINVFVHPIPVAYAGTDTTICSGSTVTLSASGGDSYVWSNGNNQATQQVSPTVTTTYYVTVNNEYGCSDIDDVTITVNQTPIAIAGGNQTICFGETAQLSASGGTTYQWSADATLSNVNIANPIASPITTTTYFVTVSNGNCYDVDSTTIFVQSLPVVDAGQDTTIYQGESLQLWASTNASISIFSWSPTAYLSQTDILNPIASPQTTITYTITVTDNYGCQNSDNITITVEDKPVYELIIYNTFTPNGDGMNDTWYIENIDRYPYNLVQVYNRNGHKVYEKSGYLNEWDGKYYGNNLPAATYYYIIDLGNGSEIIKGNVTIVR